MNAPIIALLVLVILAGIAACLGIWLLQSRHDRAFAVKVEGGVIYVGKDGMAFTAISSIEIAPMYDVAPADDLWTFKGESGTHLSFFNRDTGAKAVLAVLNTALPGFNSERSLSLAREESLFEQPVTVWLR